MLNKLLNILICFGLSLGLWQVQGQGLDLWGAQGPGCRCLCMVWPCLVWKIKGRSCAGRVCSPMARFVCCVVSVKRCLSRGVPLVTNQPLCYLKSPEWHFWTDIELLKRKRICRGNTFLQETLRLVKQKSDFEAVPDPNHSGAVIPIWILCSRALDDFMCAGENCCLQLLHSYWNIQE